MAERRFVVHTSNRLEELLRALAERLASDPLPPLAVETIVVPGQGIARWLRLRLAEEHGIASSLDLPFPGTFLERLGASAAGSSSPDDGEAKDLFDREVLTWRIHRLLGDARVAAELGPALRYCRDDPDGRKRFQLARSLAARFDDYQLYRDDVLLAWANGTAGSALPHAGWQGKLWRALLRDAGADVAAPAGAAKAGGRLPFPELAAPAAAPNAHRLQHLRALLAAGDAAKKALPPRVSVFGAVTLPPAFVDLLRRIAEHVPVTLYVPAPSPHYFGDAGDGNPLLARLGTEAREFANLLLDADPGGGALEPLPFAPPDESCLLAALQTDVAELQDRGAPDGPQRLRLRQDDDSLRVHGCHSPLREMEVIRDQLLDAFERDPSLQPHEAMVLVPDVDRYAPFAHAVFGPVQRHLPYRVADRSPASDASLCACFLRLLELARERLHVFDVLHLLEEPSLARAFGLVPGDVPVLREWCDRAAIRWGIDGDCRQRLFHVPAFDDGSWQQGLRRLLLGFLAGPGDELVADVLPAADATDSRGELLAAFVDFADALFERFETLLRPHTLQTWAELLDGLLDDLFVPADADEVAAAGLARDAIMALRAQAAAAQSRDEIAPAVLLDALRALLQKRAGATGFLGGSIAIAALLPMRAVPVRVLCIAGLDDASFPRRERSAPFDLVAAERRRGDRSRRLDDRQLFLDAVLAAREKLVLTYVSRSSKDDSECAPSVVLDELLDYVDAAFLPPARRSGGYASASAFVRVQHPLQAFSRRYRDGADPRLFTYGRYEKPKSAAPPQSQPASPPAPEQVPPRGLAETARGAADLAAEIPLSRLLDFWRSPCQFFLRHVLRVQLPRSTDRDGDCEPFALHNLDRYRLQDAALRRALRGEQAAANPQALARAAGVLPPGALGDVDWADAAAEGERLLARALAGGLGTPQPLAVRGADFAVTAEVEGFTAAELRLPRAAKLQDKDALRGWIHHVFVAAARLQGAAVPARTRVLGKDGSFVFEPLDAGIGGDPLARLSELVAGMRRGIAAPLPFFVQTSRACAAALRGDSRADWLRDARKEWHSARETDDGRRIAGEGEDAWVELCFRDRDPLQDRALAAEFLHWAQRIWGEALARFHREEQ